MPILRTLTGPADLRGLSEVQLIELAGELRQAIVSTVARTGGHLGSSLGVVELTIALHRLLDSPRDKIVWDTGHQAYPHKLLTGRLDRFGTLRQIDGVGGFPRRSESPHDVFDGGHAGTGLSIAEGLATARDLRHGLEKIVVVVGDAALMSGLALEALNDIGQRQTRLLIVLNDNGMSISPTVGALSQYLSTIKLSPAWQRSKSAYDRAIERLPLIGKTALERDQVSFHGAALPPMPSESEADDAAPPARPVDAGRKPPNYTSVMVGELIELARSDRRIVAITAGMPTGTGLNRFQAEFPDRFIDVGISEPHAVTLATGLAIGGERPVVAIYSTFLQRAFDQTVHDVCQNDQPVLLAVDRAGLVGEDGTSHQGMFTIPAQRQLPNLIVASPRDEQELRSLVRTALAQDHPFALHYPRDPGLDLPPIEPRLLPVGQGELLREGSEILLVGFGPIVQRAMTAAETLAGQGWSVGVINARFVKPIDRQLILEEARGKRLVVTLEESVVTGGFGTAVLELLEEARLADPAYRDVALKIIGIPGDRFVDHGSVADLRRRIRLDAEGIAAQIGEALGTLRATPGRTQETAASA